MTKLDVYNASASWWIHPALLVLRICQSSMLALFKSQRGLAVGASIIAIAGVVLMLTVKPYRRESE